MAFLTHYTVVNGVSGKQYPYEAEVSTQSDIDAHRDSLLNEIGREHDGIPVNILFTLKEKLPISVVLTP